MDCSMFDCADGVLGALGIAALCGLAAGVIFLVPAIVMWLWNRTMPDIFRLPTIAYWQAFRLFILCMILFGGGAHNC